MVEYELELTVVSYNGEPPVPPLSKRLEAEGLTLGRDPDNDFVLEDAERLVSRRQARLMRTSATEVAVDNVSSCNAMLINERELLPGQRCVIGIPGRVLVGRYLLSLSVGKKLPPAGRPSVSEWSPEPLRPVPLPEMPDIFAVGAPPAPKAPLAGETLPEDFYTAFGGSASLLDSLPQSSAEPIPEPMRDLHPIQTLGDKTGSTIDPLALFSSPLAEEDLLGSARNLDHALEIHSPFIIPAATRATQENAKESSTEGMASVAKDRDALMGSGILEGISLEGAKPGGTEIFSEPITYSEPAPSEPVQNPPPPPPASTFPADAAPKRMPTPAPVLVHDEYAQLRHAFAKGCGLPESSLPALSPEFMESLGALLMSMTTGAVRLIQARSATKHELRANVTMIVPAGNNPLKFAPDGQAAIMQLLSHRLPGFMAPLDAIDDAFNDLAAHHAGLVAGARAAVYDVLGRFKPAVLEQRLNHAKPAFFFGQSARKAKLWELYEEKYTSIAGEAQEEFELSFQRAFAQAYEQEIEKFSGGVHS